MTETKLADLADPALVELCQIRGIKDDRPFEELFRRHRSVVWHTCYTFLRNVHDAEDVVQDVFFKAYVGLPQFEGRASFRTWLNQIAINTCKNELRKRSRRPLIVQTELENFERIRDIADRPDQRWHKEADRENLAQVLETLHPDHFTALQLRDLEGRVYAEIADMLGISQGAAKMRVQRARLAMKAVLEQLNSKGDKAP